MSRRSWGRIARLAALVGSALGLGVAQADTVVHVQPGATGPAVNRAVTAGYNFGNWMAVAEWKDELAKVPAGALRFPGGNIGDEQDMDAPSLDTFRALLTLVRGQPELMVQTRVFRGRPDRPAANTPEDAALAVRMARERGLSVQVWEIGNEPDLFSVTRGDASWTPQRYCEVFRAQAAAIRREDPAALIAGPAVSGALPGAARFLEEFVEGCGDVVDVLTWHIYPTEGDGTEEWALSTVAQVDQDIARYRAIWSDPRRNPRGHTRPVRLGVTEFGLSWKTDRPRFLADQTAALWAAEAALRMARQGVSLAHYFAYQGTGFHGLLDVGGVPRPTYYGFGLLSRLQGHFVPATSGSPAVWAHAARAGEQTRVVLINTATTAQPVRLDAPGWRATGARGFDAATVEAEAALLELPVRDGRVVLPARGMALVTLEMAR
jgi:hypothetical protein